MADEKYLDDFTILWSIVLNLQLITRLVISFQFIFIISTFSHKPRGFFIEFVSQKQPKLFYLSILDRTYKHIQESNKQKLNRQRNAKKSSKFLRELQLQQLIKIMNEQLPFATHLQKYMKIYQFPSINSSKPSKINQLQRQEPSLPSLTNHKMNHPSKKILKYHRIKTEQQSNNEFLLNNLQQNQRPTFSVVKKRSPQHIQKQLLKAQRRRQFSQKVIKPSINSAKFQTYTEVQIKQDKLKHPHKYQILSDENGFNDEKVYKMKNQQLNFQLQQFTKEKGKEYFENMVYQARLGNKNSKAQQKNKTFMDSSSNQQQKSKKYPNYIPQVFQNLKLKKSKQKKQEQKKQQKKERIKPIINEKLLKLRLLSEKQEILGKVVFDQVNKHFHEQKKQGNKYFYRVKSEQQIDSALIQFLKTKIDRAQVQLT